MFNFQNKFFRRKVFFKKSLSEMLIFMVGSGRKKPDLTRLNPKQEKTGGSESTPELVRHLIIASLERDPAARPAFEERFFWSSRKMTFFQKNFFFKNFSCTVDCQNSIYQNAIRKSKNILFWKKNHFLNSKERKILRIILNVKLTVHTESSQ